jgi:PAS domain S-box-containing protein
MEEVFKTIFEVASDGMLLGDPQSREFCLGNRKISEMLGYELYELKKLKVEDIYPKDALPHALEQIRKLINKEIAIAEGMPVKRKNGSIFYADITASYLQIGDKVYLLSIFRDVTERRKLEKALQEDGQKIRTIFDQSFQFIGLMTTDGTLIEANKAALEFTGMEASSILNKPFWETPWWTHSLEMQEKLRSAVKKAAEGEFIRFEATHVSKDGSLHYIDFSLKPVKDKTGKVIFLIPEGRDITEFKKASGGF